LTAHFLAQHLKPYGVEPRDVRIDDEVLKGYELCSFAEAFQTYLSPPTNEPAVSKRDNATMPGNIEENSLFTKATEPRCSVSENAVPANIYADCSVVADTKPVFADAMLI
jgi:hypothetical protein